MIAKTDKLGQMIIKKNEFINQCKQTLKEEFVGLNVIIDKVVDSVSLWYYFPELKEKPVMIDLWGLTGVEKPSLVQRLSELLNFHNKFYLFDLDNKPEQEQLIEEPNFEEPEKNYKDLLNNENYNDSGFINNISEIIGRF